MAARFARNNGWDGRDRLAKICEEGFALIDDQLNGGNRLHGPGGGSYAATFHQEPQYSHHRYLNQYHGPQAVTVKQQPVITSEYQDSPSQYYHRRQYRHHQSYHVSYEPQVFTVKKQPVITSDDAAELFGGMVVVDHRAKFGFN